MNEAIADLLVIALFAGAALLSRYCSRPVDPPSGEGQGDRE